MDKKISVIVPVYNVEHYLAECVQSLMNQTFQDLEVLLVDDGSTDQSAALVDRYASQYPDHIIAFHKENGGMSDARNFGLQHATGEYIAFVDSDDIIMPDAYEKAYTCAMENKSDIVLWDLEWFYPNGDTAYHAAFSRDFQELNAAGYLFSDPSPCNKLMRRSIFEEHHVVFPQGIWYEDMATIPGLVRYIDRFDYIPTAFYRYRQRDQSIMNQTAYNNRLLDIIPAMEHLSTMLDEKYQKELEYLYIFQLLYIASARFMQFKKYEDITTCYNVLVKHFPNWKQNTYYQKKPKLFQLYCELLSKRKYRQAHLLMQVKKKIRG